MRIKFTLCSIFLPHKIKFITLRSQMLQQVADFLVSQGKLTPQNKQNFFTQNQDCSPYKMVQLIYKKDSSLIEKMIDIPSMKGLLFTVVNETDLMEVLTNKLGSHGLMSQEQLNMIDKLIKNHGFDLRQILKIFNQKENLIQDEIEGFVKDCQSSLAQKIISQLEVPTDDTQRLDTEREKLSKLREELQQDINQIPSSLDQHKLRKMEIDFIQKILENKEPTLSIQDKKYLNSLAVVDPEAKSARDCLIQGTHILNNLKVFRRKFCGLDYFLVKRIVEEGRRIKREALQQIQNGKKIKIIFVMGLTGSGKTTLISKMVGLPLHKVKVKGIPTIQPVNLSDTPEQYRHLVIGYSNSSMTLYPRVFKIPKEFLTDDDQDNYDAVYGMDSAGFFDTNGEQVQIANRISIMEILGSVEDVQIAILMNQRSWGARGQGFEGLLSAVSNIIDRDKLSKIKQSISIIFNQYDDADTINSLHANITDLESNIQNRGTAIIDENSRSLMKIFKFQTKNPKTMRRFDPLKDHPKQLYRKITEGRLPTSIKQVLSRSIGSNLKKFIQDDCENFKSQAKLSFQKGQLQQTQFFLRILQYVGEQRKMDTKSDDLITDMKKQIERKRKKQIEQFQKNLQQYLITNWGSVDLRNKRIKEMRSQLQQLKEQIAKFLKIVQDQETGELEEELKNMMQKFMEEYKEKMNDSWSMINSQAIVQTFKNGIALFQQFFPNQKVNILVQLEEQKNALKKEIVSQITSLQKQHGATKKWKQYEVICQILDSDIHLDHFTQKFQQTYEFRKKRSLIVDIDKVTKNIQVFPNEDEKIKQTEEFLSFIHMIPSYPKRIIQNYLKVLQTDYNFITKEVPKELYQRFDNIVKKYSDFQDHEQLEEEKGAEDDIEEIKLIIKSLKTLEKVNEVGNLSVKKIQTEYGNLINMIERELRRLENLKEAFLKIDYDEIKNKTRKCRRCLNKLQKLVRIIEHQQVKTRFKELKIELGDQIFCFIDKFDQAPILLSSIRSLEKKIDDWNRLKEFQFVYQMLGENQRLFDRIKNKQTKIKDAIKQPLNRYLEELTTRKLIIPYKLSNFQSYIQCLHQDLQLPHEESIQALQENIKKQLQLLKQDTIIKPLDDLKTQLQSGGIDDSSIEKMFVYLSKANIQTLRRACKVAAEVEKHQNIQEYIDDIKDYKGQIIDKFQYFRNNLEIRIEKKMPINLTHQLKTLLHKLKSIEDSMNEDKKYFSDLIQSVDKRIVKQGQDVQSFIEKIRMKNYITEQFNCQQIVDIYKRIKDDQSETGQQNMNIMLNFLSMYGPKTSEKLNNIKIDMMIDEKPGKLICNFLLIIKTHHENQNYIVNRVQPLPNLSIPNLQAHLLQIENRILQYYRASCEEIPFLRDNLKRRIEKLASIESLKQDIKTTGLYEFPSIQEELEKQNQTSLVEIIRKKRRTLNQKKETFMKNKSLNLQSIASDFKDLFMLASEHEKNQLCDKVSKEFQKIIKDLQRNIKTIHYKQYEKNMRMMKSVIEKLPVDLQKKQLSALDQYESYRERHHEQKFKDIEQGFSAIKEILNYGEQIKNQQDQDKMKQLSKILMAKYMDVKELTPQQCIDELIGIYNCQQDIEKQYPEINKIYFNYKTRLMQKIKNHLERCTDSILNQFYKEENDSDLTSSSLTERLMQSRTKQRAGCLSFIKKAFNLPEGESDRMMDNSKSMIKKSLQDKIIQCLEYFKQKMQEIIQTTHRNMQQIIIDPKENRQELFKTFSNINLLKKTKQEFDFLGEGAKNQIKETLKAFQDKRDQIKHHQPLNLYDFIANQPTSDQVTELLWKYQNQRENLRLLWFYLTDSDTFENLNYQFEQEIQGDCERCKKDIKEALRNEDFFDEKINGMLRALQQIEDDSFSQLMVCNIYFRRLIEQYKEMITQQNSKCERKIEQAISSRGQNKKQKLLVQIKQHLFKIEKIANLDIFAQAYLSDTQNHIRKLRQNSSLYHQLFKLIKQSKGSLKQSLFAELLAFENSAPHTINKQVKSYTDILSQMERKRTITDEQKDNITFFYNKFISEYNQLLSRVVISGQREVIDQIRSSFYNHKQQDSIGDPNKRTILIAKIFFLWQLTQEKKNEFKQYNQIKCRATPAQIICCLFLIGIDDCHDVDIIKVNRLAEVPAGEGKTIMIGILAVYLAIYGFEVHWLCEQQFLCEKNEKNFKKLFSMCEVFQTISYGTCEDLLKSNLRRYDKISKKQTTYQKYIERMIDKTMNNPEDKNDRAMVAEMIGIQSKSQKRILLIDEIGSLFDPKYYGKTLKETITLRDKTINNLFQFIWKNQNLKLTVKDLIETKQFGEVVNRYPSLENLCQNQLYGILEALQTYKDYHYVVRNKDIMYKVGDIYQIQNYGYNTVFAYLHENKLKNNSVNLQGNIGITICVGQFSYSCLPNFYTHILGMATILKQLPSKMLNQLMKRCRINKQQMTSVPLAYKRSSKIIDERTISVEKQSLNRAIVKSFEKEFKNKRPIILIFKNKVIIDQFWNSQEFQRFKYYAKFITEDTKAKIWDDLKPTDFQNKIILIEEKFIKGTHFEIYDQDIKEGFHVVATYFIQSPIVHAQAKGKVKRNFRQGSFIQIAPIAINRVEDSRENLFNRYNNIDEQQIQAHNELVGLFNSSIFSENRIIDYIERKNVYSQYDQYTKRCRIPFLIDGSSSMGLFLENFKLLLPNIFRRIHSLSKNVLLLIKIIVFRNYNSPYHELVQTTGFQINHSQLSQFLKGVQAKKGQGNQAVEVGLQLVTSIQNVNTVFIFSDTRGNSGQEIKAKRQNSQKKFEEERKNRRMKHTTADNEVKYLMNKGIKVNGFYLKDSGEIREYYEKMAEKTGGKSHYIDITDQNAVYRMQQEIVDTILEIMLQL